jgi:glycerol-3-phosphate cytidylyltransferase
MKIIGYTQGTYDMFHIGHLNLLRNAKRKCDYLIVGVNTDELIQSYKKKDAIVPLEERMAIVSSLRFVNEVIPRNSLDKKEICLKYHINKVFIGDDWKGNERWNQTEKELKPYGIEVVYLPYTQSTSSTLLREKLKGY